MKNRCILSLLICGALFYYALPQLSLHGQGLATYFSWTWLGLLFMAIAGNLAAILYTPKRRKHSSVLRKVAKTPTRSYQRAN